MDDTQGTAEPAGAQPIDCSGSLDITVVQSLYQRLSDALEAEAPVELDVSATERFDGAAAQLLLAFVTAARERGLDVAWQQPSAAVTDTVRLLGLGEALDFPEPA
jgi:anti-anti-sigma regulatory factor